MWNCHYCRSALSASELEKNRMCPKCGSDLHSCKNCSHFDSQRNQCLETESPWIADRTAENSCDFFEMRESRGQSTVDVNAEAEKAKEAFRALFRTPS